MKVVVRSQDSKSLYYNLYISAYLQCDNQTIQISNMISEEKIKGVSICVSKEMMTSNHFLSVTFNYVDLWGYGIVDEYCLYKNGDMEKIEFLKREENTFFYNLYQVDN